jgi:V/A-type H+-transporting ATPase subunit D
MRTASPTRAALLELQDEQRALHEGHVFLDEKCLLLAGEMLRQLARHAALAGALTQAHDEAMRALRAALARHGLQGLQVRPPLDDAAARLATQASSLMGVRLLDAAWQPGAAAAPPSAGDSPELRRCRAAFAALLAAVAPLAAVSGNLERLSADYRRSVRRARALQDVLLPDVRRDIAGIESRLEELEQEDAIAMRRGAAPARDSASSPAPVQAAA